MIRELYVSLKDSNEFTEIILATEADVPNFTRTDLFEVLVIVSNFIDVVCLISNIHIFRVLYAFYQTNFALHTLSSQ